MKRYQNIAKGNPAHSFNPYCPWTAEGRIYREATI